MIIFLLNGPKKIEPWDEPPGPDNLIEMDMNGYSDLYESEPPEISSSKNESETQSDVNSATTLTDTKKR